MAALASQTEKIRKATEKQKVPALPSLLLYQDPLASLTSQVSCLSEGMRLCPQICQIRWCSWRSGLAGTPLGGEEGREEETRE